MHYQYGIILLLCFQFFVWVDCKRGKREVNANVGSNPGNASCSIKRSKNISPSPNFNAEFGEFPWMVAIIRLETKTTFNTTKEFYECAGSIIHPRVGITAAHCVKTRRPTSRKTYRWKVRAGEWNAHTDTEMFPHQEKNIQSIVQHPEFNASLLLNDIALFTLESDLEFKDHIGSVCIPPANFVTTNTVRCFLTAWGKHNFDVREQNQGILKKYEVPIIDRDNCETALRTTRLSDKFILHSGFTCTGKAIEDDLCSIGDGGSPLVCPVPGVVGQYYQIGIYSWRVGCSAGGITGVYAAISAYREWIDSKLIALDITKSN